MLKIHEWRSYDFKGDFARKNRSSEPGLNLYITFWGSTSCQTIGTFHTGIRISLINHIAFNCSQYSGGPSRGHGNHYRSYLQHNPVQVHSIEKVRYRFTDVEGLKARITRARKKEFSRFCETIFLPEIKIEFGSQSEVSDSINNELARVKTEPLVRKTESGSVWFSFGCVRLHAVSRLSYRVFQESAGSQISCNQRHNCFSIVKQPLLTHAPS